MREVADVYRRARPGTTFDFKTSNSTMALRQLALEQTDFAFIERNPRADELERATATALELGRDAVYVVTHPRNPISNLSTEELRKVLTGQLNQWSQLGVDLPGSQDAIQVLSREEGSGMRAVIEEKVLDGARLTPTALLLPTNLDMLDYVSEHPTAIGYVAANIWDENSGTRTVALDGVRASRRNVRDGEYPLLQTVFLIVPQTPDGDLAAFLEYLASSEGRATLYRRIQELPPK
jgi:phosphate transport system substrate-binding protein